MESSLHLKLACGIPPDRRSEVASHLVSKSSRHDEFAKSLGGRSAIQKLLNGGKLSAHYVASMGKIQGTLLCISGLINLRKCKSVTTHLRVYSRPRRARLPLTHNERKPMSRLDSVTPVRRGLASVSEVIPSVDKGHYHRQRSAHVP